MILATIGIVLVVIAIAGVAGRQAGGGDPSPAQALLDGRLAQGEISVDEHRRRRRVLVAERPRRSPRGALLMLGALGLVLLLSAAALSGPAGPGNGWWGGHAIDMGEHMGWNRTADTPTVPPVAGAPERVVEAGDLWFEPARVEAEAGSTINLVLDNTGQTFHDLSIPELDVHLEAEPGRTVSTALRTPDAGTYDFVCTVPGHAAGGMRGQLVVVPSR